MSTQSTRKSFIQYELPTKALEQVQGGKGKVTTLAVGEEGGTVTTTGVGEECCEPRITTFGLGEEAGTCT
ncbi:hypothetical protein [Hyalangium gracile]|uniref:hypothetical protein n=1 Tax=Hyalangium gracile TaxID=394092 RepID=UPI001CCC1E68|nr:hypothetical protein [Hyalangium gracile]